MRSLVGVVGLVALLSGCSASVRPPTVVTLTSTEWGPGTTDIRRATALVRVTPPARLKATFENTAARTDDPDFADFLRAHAGGGFGSGFLVTHMSTAGTAAFVVTNRHVIAKSTEAEVSFSLMARHTRIAKSFTQARSTTSRFSLCPSQRCAHWATVCVRPRPMPRIASRSWQRGYPAVGGRPSYQITDGKVSNAKFDIPELGMGESLVQHTAPIDPGSSGGPLTDESGALVGVDVMLIRQRASMFFAVPSSAVVETVRYAHALNSNKTSAQWMTAELDKACTSLSSELAATTKQHDRLTSFVSNAAVADRGLESFTQLSRSEFGPGIRSEFFHDPMSAMRHSVLIRIGVRSSQAGGASGSCASLSPSDAGAIAEGKPVRRAVMTNSGHALEVTWTFEHGAWRVANGEMVDIEAPPPAPAPTKTAKTAAKKAVK